MKCENDFCIYEANGKCILDEISINSLGACDECIYPNIDRDYLEKQKQKLLKKYEEIDNR